MPTEMADYARRRFNTWFSSCSPEIRDLSLSVAYLNWLRDGEGFADIGEQYGLAVETLLLILTGPETPTLPIVSDGDSAAWEFMTECGFRYEVFQHRDGLRRL